MVHTKSITKYVVCYEAYVTVELNENLEVITHNVEHCDDLDACYQLMGDQLIDLYPDEKAPEGCCDYSAVMGNASSYVNGMPVIFRIGMNDDVLGQGENNDEPF